MQERKKPSQSGPINKVWRQKRQVSSPDYNAAEKSGVPIFDHAYGDQHNSRVGYQLAIYPKLMGDLDDGQAYNQGLNQNNNQPQNTQPAEISWGDFTNFFFLICII